MALSSPPCTTMRHNRNILLVFQAFASSKGLRKPRYWNTVSSEAPQGALDNVTRLFEFKRAAREQ